jgi:hypothetical protein
MQWGRNTTGYLNSVIKGWVQGRNAVGVTALFVGVGENIFLLGAAFKFITALPLASALDWLPSLLMLAGGTIGFLLPVIPWFFWTGTLVQYFINVFIVIFGTPFFIAKSMCNLKEGEVFNEEMQGGVIKLISLFFVPVLMVLSMLIAMILSDIAVFVMLHSFGDMFSDFNSISPDTLTLVEVGGGAGAVAGTVGGAILGGPDGAVGGAAIGAAVGGVAGGIDALVTALTRFVFVLLLLGASIFFIMKSCFEITHTFPTRVLAWAVFDSIKLEDDHHSEMGQFLSGSILGKMAGGKGDGSGAGRGTRGGDKEKEKKIKAKQEEWNAQNPGATVGQRNQAFDDIRKDIENGGSGQTGNKIADTAPDTTANSIGKKMSNFVKRNNPYFGGGPVGGAMKSKKVQEAGVAGANVASAPADVGSSAGSSARASVISDITGRTGNSSQTSKPVTNNLDDPDDIPI